jgi:formylglycine-generating enzyme required for sulfatase activity
MIVKEKSLEARMMKRLLNLTLLLFLLISSQLKAEHRVALIVNNYDYQLKEFSISKFAVDNLTQKLEALGFRTTMKENLGREELKTAIESFVNATPTRGTALVYFRGQVKPGNYKGKNGHFITSVDVKKNDPREIGNTGYEITQLLQFMHSHGGASNNFVLLENTEPISDLKEKSYEDTFIASVKADSLGLQLSSSNNLIATIESNSDWSINKLTSQEILGEGSRSISPPDQFVLGQQAGDEWVNGRGVVFCWCPAGSYLAGSPESEAGRYDDETQKETVIKEGFWISKYEMTLRENVRNHPRGTIAKHKNDPLTMIHLDDGKSMVSRTITEAERKQKRLPSDWQYSLPTEEQWEYAARAGTTSRFYFGDDEKLLTQHANFGDQSYYASNDIFSNAAHRTLNDGAVRLAIVGIYQPNSWGLYDVYGNVSEWCLNTAIRGGSWVSSPDYCRSAHRDSFSSRNQQNFIGYRLVIQKVSLKPAKK